MISIHMRKMALAALAAIIVLAAMPALAADIVSAQYRTANHDLPKTLRILARGDHIAINPGLDGAVYGDTAGGAILVLDAKKGELVDVVALAEVARSMGFAGAGTGGAGGGAALQQGLDTAQSIMAAQIDKILESVPENQRPMMRKQLEAQMNIGASAGAGAAVPTGDLRAEATGKKKKFGQHRGREVHIFRGDELVRTVWVTDARNLEGGKRLLRSVRRFDALYDKTTEGIPGAEDRSFFSDFQLLDGLPLAAVIVDEGRTEWVYDGAPAASEAELMPPDLPIRRRP